MLRTPILKVKIARAVPNDLMISIARTQNQLNRKKRDRYTIEPVKVMTENTIKKTIKEKGKD